LPEELRASLSYVLGRAYRQHSPMALFGQHQRRLGIYTSYFRYARAQAGDAPSASTLLRLIDAQISNDKP
jgi:hypothetical protein